MLKIRLLLAVLAASAVLLTGCSPKDEAASSTQANKAASAPSKGDIERFATVDLNGDKVVTPEELSAPAHQLFAMLKAADAEAITAYSLKAALTKNENMARLFSRRGVRPEDSARFLHRLANMKPSTSSKTGSGSVLTSSALEATSATFLQNSDINQDGAVTLEEWTAPLHARLQRLDANADGTLTVEEMSAQHKR